MLHAPGTDPAPLRALVDAGVSGLILMGDNMPATPPELAALTEAVQADADAPVLLGIDEEGGEVQRLPWDGAAGAEQLRAAPPPAAEEAFGSRAAALSDVGVDVNFGIVADVTADPASFIAGRVLGGDPQSAADRVAAAVAGERGTRAEHAEALPGPRGSAGRLARERADRAAHDRRVARGPGDPVRGRHRRGCRARDDGPPRLPGGGCRAGVALTGVAPDPARGARLRRRRRDGRHADAAAQRRAGVRGSR